MFCLRILSICVKNDCLAPTTVSMETKLFKSEYALCVLKIQKKQIEIGEIFLHIRCLCFIININIKGKLPEYFTMLFEKCFPRGSINYLLLF